MSRERTIQALLVRLGGEYERADQARDYAAKVRIEEQIERTGALLSEDYAWWLMVIRGRNVIRAARGQDPIHF
jgi:hypothetical protein